VRCSRKKILNYFFQAILGVPRINKGQNPAAWVLEISSHITEYEIGVDYAEIYRNSSLYRYRQYYSHTAAIHFIILSFF
jgi:hypothetical protein